MVYYDSMGGEHRDIVGALLRWVVDETKDKRGETVDPKQWKTRCVPERGLGFWLGFLETCLSGRFLRGWHSLLQ